MTKRRVTLTILPPRYKVIARRQLHDGATSQADYRILDDPETRALAFKLNARIRAAFRRKEQRMPRESRAVKPASRAPVLRTGRTPQPASPAPVRSDTANSSPGTNPASPAPDASRAANPSTRIQTGFAGAGPSDTANSPGALRAQENDGR